jgi:hypothetical protein
VLRHDATGQEVLLNLLLRNYLHYNLYDQVMLGCSGMHRSMSDSTMCEGVQYIVHNAVLGHVVQYIMQRCFMLCITLCCTLCNALSCFVAGYLELFI